VTISLADYAVKIAGPRHAGAVRRLEVPDEPGPHHANHDRRRGVIVAELILAGLVTIGHDAQARETWT
jgi:hypothetical protein